MNSYRNWHKTLLMTLVLMALSVLGLVVFAHFSTDLTPDSPLGYTYAFLGVFFMLLATFFYTRAKKTRQRKVGQINNALNWHVCFGVLALFLLLLHSFGNFNPRSGTYALYAMVALVVSGVIGKLLDRTVPKMITKAARKALTEQGEDRIEKITRTVQEIVAYNTQELPGNNGAQGGQSNKLQTIAASPVSMVGGTSLPGSWDIAYVTLKETPQEVNQYSQQHRFVPDRQSPLSKPGALMPGYKEQIAELQSIQRTLQLEQFYRALIRYWRMLHVVLVLVTIGLTLWHVEFALTLLMPGFLQR